MNEWASLTDDVRYIRNKVDGLDEKVDQHQLSNEHRISKLEEKAGLYGALGGFIGAVGAYLGFHQVK